MNDRIHDWLDGELPFEALTPAEQTRARRLQAALDTTAGELGDVPAPGIAQRVMASLPAGSPARRRPLLERLRDALIPGPLALRPAAALATFSLVAGFGLGLWAASSGGAPVGEGVVAAAEAPTIFVRFDLEVADARSVHLAGSFSGWQPRYELTPAGERHWTVTVPLEPGVHDYVFVVDGERHVLDPAAPTIADGFGSYNNRIALLTSAT